ncbi:MAG: hypothetical protein LBU85_05945 [Treponema sp.]|jgi:regulator of protease activity HflC (stomatin/prohibitin superfamily)|nr:hypothetical protein [Treponema sp.]
MPENSNKPQTSKTRLFPIILGIAAVVFLNILTWYRNKCVIIGSLANLTFTMWLFLVLIIVIERLHKLELDWPELWKRGKRFLFKNKAAPAVVQEAEKPETIPEQQDGLIEIKKDNVTGPHQESISLEKRICEILYIVLFLGIAVWRITVIVKSMRLPYVEDYRLGIADAVLLLVIPCVCALYLKLRKDEPHPTDKISRGILNFFSYISFAYAAVIAASCVLKINIQVILQWVYYAASIYLAASLGINILLSMLKGSILDFDYRLFPKISLTKNKTGETSESQTAKWKVSLKSLYTIQYTLTILPALALALVFVLFVSTAVFVVQPHQQAAVYHFGKLTRYSIKDAGIHFKFPWPVDKAEIYDTRRAASMQIGYESSGGANFLWTQMHDGGEYTLLLGNGNEMVAVNLKIMYEISDLYSYIKTCTNAEAVLSAAAYSALMSRTINTTLDSFLSVDRNSLSASLLNELSDFCKSEGLGFSVVQVIIESIHPPVDIAGVYQNVVSASVDKNTAVTRAHTYAGAKVIEAARQSKTAFDQARALQYNRTSDAQKEAAVFYAAAEAHRVSPVSYELTRNLDVYEKIIKGRKVYVFSRRAESSQSKFIIGKVNTFNFPDANRGEGNE